MQKDHCLPNLALFIGVAIVLTACGGGSSSAPSSAFPNGTPTSNTTPTGTTPTSTTPTSTTPTDSTPTPIPPTVPDPVDTPGNDAPVIVGSPQTAILEGKTYTFVPAAKDADGDPLRFGIVNKPAWASFDPNTGLLQGTPSHHHLFTYRNIAIMVTDGKITSALPAFDVKVASVATGGSAGSSPGDSTPSNTPSNTPSSTPGSSPPPSSTPPLPSGNGSATVSWIPPTRNTDGSSLTNLAGYVVRWGTNSGSYPNAVTINNPGLSNYVVSGLASGTTYYFVALALNRQGVQSQFSNEARKTIP